MALFGATASTGFGAVYSAWLLPATATTLALTVVALAATGATGPAALAAAGAAALLVGRALPELHPLVYPGAATLILGVLMGMRRPASPRRPHCHAPPPPTD